MDEVKKNFIVIFFLEKLINFNFLLPNLKIEFRGQFANSEKIEG